MSNKGEEGMKSRKFISFSLALALTMSTMTSFSAEQKFENQNKADVLYNLGLLQGYSATEKVLGLGDSLVREDAMKLLAKVLGWEVDADQKSSFTDVSKWAQSYVATAADKKITNGISQELFGAKKEATLQQVVTWYLRALGYDQDASWEKAADLGIETGLLEAKDLPNLNKVANRDALVGVAYEALKATAVDKDMTLMEELVSAGLVDKDKAEEAGFVVSKEFEVTSIEPSYLVETTVITNKKIDKSILEKATIKIDNKKIAIEDLAVKEDGRGFYIRHKAIKNGEEAKITIENLKSEDGEKLSKVEKKLRYLDQTPLEILGVEAIGKREALISFSEPVKDFSKKEFSLVDEKGKRINIKSATAYEADNKGNRKIKLELYTDLKDQSYTLTVKAGVKDYAGFGVYGQEVFEVETIKEAPSILSAEVKSQQKVILTFSQNIKLTKSASSYTSISQDLIYHTNTSNKPSFVKAEGKKLTLEFPKGTEMPIGTVYMYFKEKGIVDLWGNEIQDMRYAFDIVADKEAPIVKEIKQGDNRKEIVITFEKEDLKENEAENKKNYVLKDEDSKVISLSRVSLSKDKVTLTTREDLLGVYSLEISNIKDQQNNVMTTETYEVVIKDNSQKSLSKTRAEIFKSGESEQILKVSYNFEVGTSGDNSVLDLSRYQLFNETTNKSIELADGSKDIEISLNEDKKSVDILISREDIDFSKKNKFTLSIARLEDLYGNKTKELAYSVGVVDLTNKAIPIEEVAFTNKDALQLTFDGQVDALDLEDFTFTVGNKKMLLVDVLDKKETKEGKTVFGVRTEDQFDAQNGASAELTTISKPASENRYGQKIEAGKRMTTLKDKYAPVFDKDKTKDEKNVPTKIIFNEPLTGFSPYAVTDISVEHDGKELVPDRDFQVYWGAIFNKEDTNSLFIVFKGDYARQDQDGEMYTVTVKDANYYRDRSDNKIQDFIYEFERHISMEKKVENDAKARLDNLKGALASKEKELVDANKAVEAVEKRIKDSQATKEKKETELVKVSNEVSSLRNQYSTLSNEAIQLRNKNKSVFAEFTTKYPTLNKRVSDLYKEIKPLESKVTTLRLIISSSSQALAFKKQGVAKLREEYNALYKKDPKNSSLWGMRRRISDLDTQILTATNTLNDRKQEKKKLNGKLKELQAEYNTKYADRQRIAKAYQDAQKAINEKVARATAAKKQLDEKKVKASSLGKEIRDISDVLKKAKEDLDAATLVQRQKTQEAQELRWETKEQQRFYDLIFVNGEFYSIEER